ncbi:amino acid permease [Flavobacterium columnare]|uniref:Amino acid permease n=3 Tax=Flavobacterium columnare TaxID=996 RepID=G8X5M4_FLACA|nr:amino acid permease [Flavobacterium columnare]AEW86868.1 amino acid permease [Flavobacterium columnare ATCC 49512]AMO20781.1 amino acid permease [Flavobacterium columnare]ANO47295.1 amino acid permease [Flavobacterium columnare]APT23571.1 amino acid transporter [Flavobacterium columnare]AUX19522.1 amino acid transporter [Flavobacterium columnare]
MEKQTQQFKKELGLLDGTLLVVGSMIGSGIFIVSADITRNIGSAGWLIAIWIISALITMTAAVSYGELSAMFPQAGGQYVYLKEAYNKLIAFLYGWSFFSVIQTGTIAAVGVAFSKFTAYLIPTFSENNFIIDHPSFKLSTAQIVSIITIIILTYINSKGVKNGKIIQKIFTITKIASLFGLIVFGFILAAKSEIWDANWNTTWTAQSFNKETNTWTIVSGYTLLSAIAASMVGSLFSSDAWNGVTFISGEIKNPERNVGLSLFLGTLIVSVIYILANVMYLAVMPLNAIAFAPSDRVAVVASEHIFGTTGTFIIAIMIMISTFGCNNGLIMAGSRVYYTMAKDGLFFKKAAELNNAAVPGWGLWIQCIWASLLCLTGKYGALLDFVMIIVIIFYVLTILGIFILRKKKPELKRPYKAFGYPILPALYIIVSLAICTMLLIDRTSTCGWGVLIMLIGIPIYYITKGKEK